MVAIVWFRRDLRLADQPALRAALDRNERVAAVYCLDDRLLGGRAASGARAAFLLECLSDLAEQVADRGGRLVVAHGRPEAEVPALARAAGAGEVHVTADPAPFARRRDRAVARALAAEGIPVYAHPGLSVADDVTAVATTQGRPYTVFTPFWRRWAAAPRRSPLPVPGRIEAPNGLPRTAVPSLASLGLREAAGRRERGGERAAAARAEEFLAGPVLGYHAGRDRLLPAGSSRLSAYLRFGCLSPRGLEARLPPGEGPEQFRRQLCWRDFYQHVLAHHPNVLAEEFSQRYRGRLSWRDDPEAFTAWSAGRTGFPLVDAGMRQLRREGWMPGRVRLLAASFLVKDLGIDWRAGEAWFMRHLLDGDPAQNNGNWQWVASVGVDPAPPFRRLYNPGLHRDRYDPDGSYVRAYVPELARVPDRQLSEPWRMTQVEQSQAGCVIGDSYPAPIVDHAMARQEALARYRAASARSGRSSPA